MRKLLGLAFFFCGIGPLTVGVASIAVNAWSRDWRGLAVSALILALGMVFIDGGRYLIFAVRSSQLIAHRKFN